jgi:hypothetical protein
MSDREQTSGGLARVKEILHISEPFRERAAAVGLAVMAGAIIGCLAAYCLGMGLRPASPKAMQSAGWIESLRLPEGARSKGSVKSFVVKFLKADDYARVFLNNYAGLSTTYYSGLFYDPKPTDVKEIEKREAAERFAMDRRNHVGSERDIAELVIVGQNYLIFEAENSAWGGCDLRVDILVNGVSLEGFPRTLTSQRVDRNLVNDHLVNRFRDIAATNRDYPALSVSDADDALCERRVFSFLVAP